VLDRGVTTPEGGGGAAKRRRRWATAGTEARPALGVALGVSLEANDAVASRSRARSRLISPVISAIAVKDLRYFWRDPQIKASLLSSLVLLFVVFAPNLTQQSASSRDFFAQHLAGLQPLLAPLPALLIVLTLSLNAFGLERQGLQSLMLTPARPIDILWGKNLAVGIVAFTAQVVLIVAVCAVTGDWNGMPLALVEGASATLALLGAGNVTSTLLPLRVRQLRMGSNNLSSESGCLRSVISLVALWVTLFTLLPVFILLLLPALLEHRQWYLFAAPLALVYGLSLYQFATILIAPRLLKRAPEILATVAREA
jgi:ABC-2 type transport system permease protein